MDIAPAIIFFLATTLGILSLWICLELISTPNVTGDLPFGGHSHKQYSFIHLAPVVLRVDNTIHWITHFLVDSVVYFVNTSPLHRDSNNLSTL